MSHSSYESLHDLGSNERHDCGEQLTQVITCTDCPTTMTVEVKWNAHDREYDMVTVPMCDCGSEDWVRGEIVCGCGYEF